MAEVINAAADPEVNIIFGAVVDEALGDVIRVTVVATGFDAAPRTKAPVGCLRSRRVVPHRWRGPRRCDGGGADRRVVGRQ